MRKIREDTERLEILQDLLLVGDRVRHPVFGEGVIVDVDTQDSCYVVQFDSLKTTRSLQFTAKLERVR